MPRSSLICILLLATSHPALRAQSTPEAATRIGIAAAAIPAAAGVVMWTVGDADPSGPALIIASGVVLGPAIGYWSAGMSGRGWKGLGLRSGLAVLSFIPAFGICGWNCSVDDSSYDVAWAVIATGSGAGVFSALYDLSRMHSNVKHHRARRGDLDTQIVPTYDHVTGRAGIRASLTF